MDSVSAGFYNLMLVIMSGIVILLPRIEPRIRRMAIIVGTIPSLMLFACGAYLAGEGIRPYHFYGCGVLAMFIGPVIAVGVDLHVNKK